MKRKQQEAVDGMAVVIASNTRNEDTVPVAYIAIRGWHNTRVFAWLLPAGYRRGQPILTFAYSQQLIAAPRADRNDVCPFLARAFRAKTMSRRPLNFARPNKP